MTAATDTNTATVAQRAAALRTANERRSAMATLKRDLKAMSDSRQGPSGQAARHLAQLITAGDPRVMRKPAHVVVGWLPGVGDVRLRRVLHDAGWPLPTKKVEQLSQRQRNVLALAVLRLLDPAPVRPRVVRPALLVAGRVAEFAQGWCPTCMDVADARGDGTCGWCSTMLLSSRRAS